MSDENEILIHLAPLYSEVTQILEGSHSAEVGVAWEDRHHMRADSHQIVANGRPDRCHPSFLAAEASGPALPQLT